MGATGRLADEPVFHLEHLVEPHLERVRGAQAPDRDDRAYLAGAGAAQLGLLVLAGRPVEIDEQLGRGLREVEADAACRDGHRQDAELARLEQVDGLLPLGVGRLAGEVPRAAQLPDGLDGLDVRGEHEQRLLERAVRLREVARRVDATLGQGLARARRQLEADAAELLLGAERGPLVVDLVQVVAQVLGVVDGHVDALDLGQVVAHVLSESPEHAAGAQDLVDDGRDGAPDEAHAPEVAGALISDEPGLAVAQVDEVLAGRDGAPAAAAAELAEASAAALARTGARLARLGGRAPGRREQVREAARDDDAPQVLRAAEHRRAGQAPDHAALVGQAPPSVGPDRVVRLDHVHLVAHEVDVVHRLEHEQRRAGGGLGQAVPRDDKDLAWARAAQGFADCDVHVRAEDCGLLDPDAAHALGADDDDAGPARQGAQHHERLAEAGLVGEQRGLVLLQVPDAGHLVGPRAAEIYGPVARQVGAAAEVRGALEH